MIVKRSSSAIAAVASSSASGFALGEVPPVGREAVEVVVGEDVLERRELGRGGLDLRELLGVLADDADGLRVCEEVLDVARRARGVDGDTNGADLREREVDEGPVEAVPREQREVVALPHSARQEPVRVGAHALVRLRPRDLGPSVVRLDEVRRALAARPRRRRARAARWSGGAATGRASTRLRPSRSRSELSTDSRGIRSSSAKLTTPSRRQTEV